MDAPGGTAATRYVAGSVCVASIYAAIDSGGGSGSSVKTFKIGFPTDKIPLGSLPVVKRDLAPMALPLRAGLRD